MHRDMDLVRRILLSIANGEPLRYERMDDSKVAAHIQIMIDAGLVIGTAEGPDSSPSATWAAVDRITWDGYEFLDAARDDALWKQVTKRIRTTTTTVSFEVLKKLLDNAAVKMME